VWVGRLSFDLNEERQLQRAKGQLGKGGQSHSAYVYASAGAHGPGISPCSQVVPLLPQVLPQAVTYLRTILEALRKTNLIEVLGVQANIAVLCHLSEG
jgi:hypothetical protein